MTDKYDENWYMEQKRGVGLLQEKSIRGGLTEAEVKLKRSLEDQLKWYDKRYHSTRKGGWIPLYSGRRFWLEDPRPEDIDINDIAHALSMVNRYNGHTHFPYSVAQHSVLVSYLVPSEYMLAALLHDASEAYIHDIIRPLKLLIEDRYGPIEEAVMRAIALKFGFPLRDSACQHHIKKADNVLLATEIRDLTPSRVRYLEMTEAPLPYQILPMQQSDAKQLFLDRYEQLCLKNPVINDLTNLASPPIGYLPVNT